MSLWKDCQPRLPMKLELGETVLVHGCVCMPVSVCARERKMGGWGLLILRLISLKLKALLLSLLAAACDSQDRLTVVEMLVLSSLG